MWVGGCCKRRFAEVQMQGGSGLNAQDRGIKSSVKNVAFVIRRAAPGAGVQGADECAQLIEGSRLPAEPQQHTQLSWGCPSNPVSSIQGAPKFPHTERNPLYHTLAPDADQTPSSAPQRTLRPQTNISALLCPFACFPLPPTSFPTSLHGPFNPSPPVQYPFHWPQEQPG